VEVNSTGGQGSLRAVAPSDDDDDLFPVCLEIIPICIIVDKMASVYVCFIYLIFNVFLCAFGYFALCNTICEGLCVLVIM
jgi:hypothetical protein